VKDDVLTHAPPTGVRFDPETETARLVEVLAAAYYRLDTDIDQLRRDRYLETATGIELERRARPLDVERPAGEGDPRFRRRALAGRARATSRTTFEDFADVCLAVLDAAPDDVQLSKEFDTEPGAIIVTATSDTFDEALFAEPEIIRFLEASLPMSRRVILRRLDGFQFSIDGEAPGKGFGEGQWTE